MYEGLGSKLRRLLAILDGDLQSVYDELGVDFRPRFFPVVQILLDQDDCSVGELARRMAISQPAATQTVNEMKRLGLLGLARSPDKRQRRVRLTPAGHELAVSLAPVWAATERAAAGFDTELEHGLSKPIDDALAALGTRQFRDRIREQLARK